MKMPALFTMNGRSSGIRFLLQDAHETLLLLLPERVDRRGLAGTNLSSAESGCMLCGSRTIDVDQHASAVTFARELARSAANVPFAQTQVMTRHADRFTRSGLKPRRKRLIQFERAPRVLHGANQDRS